MIWNKRHFFMVTLWAVTLLVGAIPAMAHNVDIADSLDATGVFREYEHDDDNPFKGFVNLSVTNTGTEAWGDFHFYIFDARGIDSSSAIFTDEFAPTSSQVLLDYAITDNDHTLNLLFYGDAVLPGETATFSVYTDNTASGLDFFGIGFYATPVPVPGALLLLGSGLLGLLGIRRRHAGAR